MAQAQLQLPEGEMEPCNYRLMQINMEEKKRQLAHEYREAKKRRDPCGVAEANRLKEDYEVAKTMSQLFRGAANHIDRENREKKKLEEVVPFLESFLSKEREANENHDEERKSNKPMSMQRHEQAAKQMEYGNGESDEEV